MVRLFALLSEQSTVELVFYCVFNDKSRKMPKIDDADRRILRALQRDGRMTNSALAKSVNMSEAACSERVRRLREHGVITGFTTQLDPRLLDQGLLVFIEIKIDRTSPEAFEAFARAVRRKPEVIECHMVAGGFDYLVKARVKDMDAYRDFLGSKLTTLPGIRETRTYPVMEEVKSGGALPI
jgi:Lrp/AsnC family leucine-responsive transcriptional regulator